MKRYSEEFKEEIVRKMMAPEARSVAEVHRETGVSEATLYAWRNRYRDQGDVVPADPSNPESWSGRNKLAVVIETAALNEQELSEYCRRRGLYVEQVERWRANAAGGNETGGLSASERQGLKAERKKTRRLEKELRRKDKALAEAAALLVLKKKAQALWGDGEDD